MFPDKNAKILIACDFGGRLSSDPVRQITSPTFEAMFYLKHLGYTNVKYVKVDAIMINTLEIFIDTSCLSTC